MIASAWAAEAGSPIASTTTPARSPARDAPQSPASWRTRSHEASTARASRRRAAAWAAMVRLATASSDHPWDRHSSVVSRASFSARSSAPSASRSRQKAMRRSTTVSSWESSVTAASDWLTVSAVTSARSCTESRP